MLTLQLFKTLQPRCWENMLIALFHGLDKLCYLSAFIYLLTYMFTYVHHLPGTQKRV